LRGLFNFAFNQPLAAYIRSRRLAASLDDILETDTTILDIANEYGFEYEQSYIRAFKREFGIPPGDLRKTGQVIKIRPPLHLFDENKLDDDSVLFGPDIVMFPKFHIIGKRNLIPFEKSAETAPQLGRQFWENERKQIKGVVNPDIYIGLIRSINWEEKYLEQIASVQVKDPKNIPYGFCSYTFNTSICARFRYMGQHHYYDINKNVASIINDAVNKLVSSDHIKYEPSNDNIYFAMIDTKLNEKTICQVEYYSPLSEKQQK
jgi:AraC family transcriptional regulator